MSARLRGPAAVALLLLSVAAGCGGGSDAPSTESGAGLPQAGGGGALAYATPSLPGDLDPLAARSREAQLVTRQLHEPLVASLRGPYGDSSRRPGLALSVHPSPDQTIWTVRLRDRVRFQNGTPFNASAVLANARRWQSLPEGRALLPNLFAVDAPRPDVVRFLLEKPTPDLARRLSSPRLGIVAPDSLRPAGGERARVTGGGGGFGTGPFKQGRTTGGELLLARNESWWGTPLGLGPALDAVEFRAVPADAERVRLLREGAVQVAEALPEAELGAIAADPLLTVLPGPGGIGMQRSVRGIDSAEPSPYSGVWLTTIRPG